VPHFMDTKLLTESEYEMAKTRLQYAEDSKKQMLELMRAWRTSAELAQEFGCMARSIQN
jgi:hypothetical protein